MVIQFSKALLGLAGYVLYRFSLRLVLTQISHPLQLISQISTHTVYPQGLLFLVPLARERSFRVFTTCTVLHDCDLPLRQSNEEKKKKNKYIWNNLHTLCETLFSVPLSNGIISSGNLSCLAYSTVVYYAIGAGLGTQQERKKWGRGIKKNNQEDSLHTPWLMRAFISILCPEKQTFLGYFANSILLCSFLF